MTGRFNFIGGYACFTHLFFSTFLLLLLLLLLIFQCFSFSTISSIIPVSLFAMVLLHTYIVYTRHSLLLSVHVGGAPGPLARRPAARGESRGALCVGARILSQAASRAGARCRVGGS